MKLTQGILLSFLTYIYGLPGNFPTSSFDRPLRPGMPLGNTASTPLRDHASNASGSASNRGVAPPWQPIGRAGFDRGPPETTETGPSNSRSTRASGGYERQAVGSSTNSKRPSTSSKDPAGKRIKSNQAGQSTWNFPQNSSNPSASSGHDRSERPKTTEKSIQRVINGVYAKIKEENPLQMLYSPKPYSMFFKDAVPEMSPDDDLTSYVDNTIADIVRKVDKKLQNRVVKVNGHREDVRKSFEATTFDQTVKVHRWTFPRMLLWSILKENGFGHENLNLVVVNARV